MNMAGGDNDNDDHAAAAVWDSASSGCWSLPAWHKSPDRLAAEARDMNEMAFASAAACAGKHSDPPVNPEMRSC